jgi:FkbM family methyltransferase
MIKNIKLTLKFILRFGFFNGLLLSFKFISGRVNQMSLPNTKFPISLRKNTSDLPTFKQVFLDNQYNYNYDSNTKIIIDAGANIGLFSVFMKNIIPQAKIICIEPDQENFNQLKTNLKYYENIFYENAGLWYKNVKLKIYDKHNAGKWGMVVEEDNLNGTIDAISINSIIDKYNIDKIDILKIDIETSEKYLFSKNYSWLASVKLIIIELHDGWESGCSKTFFTAINEVFNDYSMTVRGENIIIKNNDLK